MKVITPPTPFGDIELEYPYLFLAGSIEMDVAERWQDKFISAMSNYTGTILNPRRTHWDSSWKQEMSNPHFKEQVDWELDGIEMATFVPMYFDPNTKSPITLLELGLTLERSPYKLIIGCPDGFYRKGNVEIVCSRCGGTPVYNSLDAVIKETQKLLSKYAK